VLCASSCEFFFCVSCVIVFVSIRQKQKCIGRFKSVKRKWIHNGGRSFFLLSKLTPPYYFSYVAIYLYFERRFSILYTATYLFLYYVSTRERRGLQEYKNTRTKKTDAALWMIIKQIMKREETLLLLRTQSAWKKNDFRVRVKTFAIFVP